MFLKNYELLIILLNGKCKFYMVYQLWHLHIFPVTEVWTENIQHIHVLDKMKKKLKKKKKVYK